MSFFAAVYKKDFRSLFRSPAAFAYLTVFTLLSGIFYYRGFLYFSSVCAEAPRGMVLNVNEAVFTPLHSNMVLLIVLLVPLLTMRLLAEERRSGTLELLRSYPSSGAGLVAAKFLSALIVFSLGLAATFLFPVYTLAFGRVDWGPILTALLGLLLGGAFLVSIGLLFS